ncbi:MAG: hypothetical protein Q8936_10480 [Bacillota bacterium]|nr:hypothetical protein [Bacillota bacterium]
MGEQTSQQQKDIQYQIQEQLRQKLENLPRLSFMTTKFFRDLNEMQQAIDELNNNGITNLVSRTLTQNFIEDIYDLYMFLPGEGYVALKAAGIGGVIGGLIGAAHSKTLIALPLLNPVSSGGAIVTIVLGICIGAIISACFAAIISMFRSVKSIKEGYHMLTVYGDIEDKETINGILEKYLTVDL